MKILIVTDAWHPQTNGVVRTYEHLSDELTRLGHEITIVGPRDFPLRLPMPGYREIELTLFPSRRLARMIEAVQPDTIHIGTEGPLGQAAWRYCVKRNLPFTTCFHTLFPDYAARRAAKISKIFYRPVKLFFINKMRRFHNKSNAVMASTASLKTLLRSWGFTAKFYQLTRGINIDLFNTDKKDIFLNKSPIAICVGRVAIEKNLEAFLSMPWPGTKVVTGEGPDLDMLKQKYPNAIFTGKKTGADLAACYQSADLFVFPSETDTFGMVLIEAMACGLPIAAYRVTGPKDIVTEPMLGTLNDDLAIAAQQALNAPGTAEDRHTHAARHYSWQIAARQFIDAIEKSGSVLKLR